MSRNIILLSDGTGNSAAKLQRTNIWRLYQALDLAGGDQIATYDDGVGTSSFKPMAILGGALGYGLKRNVIDLYLFLCRHYQQGDRIHCFGFSRGAFTIRVLGGLIADQGLIPAGGDDAMGRNARAAFRRYRDNRYKSALGLEKPLRALRNMILNVMDPAGTPSSSEKRKVRLTFMGLWDTVGAYGLPFEELTKAWNWIFPLSVPDREPSSIVDRACHALALDDERHTFHPVLWNEANLPGANAHHISDEKISQVWFSGVHSNVGGGYPEDALAHVSLNWMLEQASAAGIRFKANELSALKVSENVLGKMYDPRRGLGGFYRYAPRKIEALTHDTNDPGNQVVIARPKVHESVFRRIESGVSNYAPIGLPKHFAVVTNNGEIIDNTTLPSTLAPVAARPHSSGWADHCTKVWNLVWWRRVVYFASVAAALALVFFPLYRPVTQACNGPFCFLSSIVRSVGALLPGFTSYWLKAYEIHPGSFSLILAILVLFLLLGGRMQTRIFDAMSALWLGPAQDPPLTSKRGVISRVLHTIANCAQRISATKTAKSIRANGLPLIAGIAVVYLAGAGVTRGVFSMLSSQGLICRASVNLSTQINRPWPSNDVCWASGIALQAGRRYIITIVTDAQWKDGRDVPASAHGVASEETQLLMRVGAPLLRYIGEPYFKPIARIGNQGSDEYLLERAHWSEPAHHTLEAEITARSNGELFLFVNDAILFYRNNEGQARVSVRPLPTPESQRDASQ